ncbi:MAG TPA: hypothetical protein VF664_20755 [Cystobacter sp.]
MKAPHLLTALSVLCPALAWSLPVHSVWSNQGLYVSEPGAGATPSSARFTINWQEANSASAFINAQATTSAGVRYEFSLVSVSGDPSADMVRGLWNVTRNGAPLCSMCAGSAYGLSQAPGAYFKIYVDGERYHLSGYITNRYDY